MLVPLSYNLRSLFVRRSATVLLTVLGIAATVATVAGVLALQQGFASLYDDNGREDVAVVLRPGATSEGVSIFEPQRARRKHREVDRRLRRPEERAAAGSRWSATSPCAASASAAGRPTCRLRGVQPRPSRSAATSSRSSRDATFDAGTDEVIVGRKAIVDRIANCRVGDVLQINTTPFRVVGIFECDGPFESEIWGDFDRMLSRPRPLRPPTASSRKPRARRADVEALDARPGQNDKETPAKVQTRAGVPLLADRGPVRRCSIFLGGFLGLVMGIAAVFTATNTMLSAIAPGRTRSASCWRPAFDRCRSSSRSCWRPSSLGVDGRRARLRSWSCPSTASRPARRTSRPSPRWPSPFA